MSILLYTLTAWNILGYIVNFPDMHISRTFEQHFPHYCLPFSFLTSSY